jgi:hypothetical protein
MLVVDIWGKAHRYFRCSKIWRRTVEDFGLPENALLVSLVMCCNASVMINVLLQYCQVWSTLQSYLTILSFISIHSSSSICSCSLSSPDVQLLNRHRGIESECYLRRRAVGSEGTLYCWHTLRPVDCDHRYSRSDLHFESVFWYSLSLSHWILVLQRT